MKNCQNKLKTLVLSRSTDTVEIDDVLQRFEWYMSSQEGLGAVHEWLFKEEDSERSLGFIFANCGQLAKHSSHSLQISALAINKALEILDNHLISTFRNVSSAIYGVSLLVQAKKINGRVDANHVASLMTKVPPLQASETVVVTQFITSCLHSLTVLINDKKLNGRMPNQLFTSFFDYLSQSADISTKSMRYSFTSVGGLAFNHQLSGKIPALAIDKLLTRGLGCELGIDDLDSMIEGLGRLAHADNLEGQLSTSVMIAFSTRLLSYERINALSIAHCIQSFGVLREKGHVDATISDFISTHLIGRFLKNRISNSVFVDAKYVLSGLASSYRSDGILRCTMTQLDQVFEMYLRGYVTGQSAINAIEYLGLFDASETQFNKHFERALSNLPGVWEQLSHDEQTRLNPVFLQLQNRPDWLKKLKKALRFSEVALESEQAFISSEGGMGDTTALSQTALILESNKTVVAEVEFPHAEELLSSHATGLSLVDVSPFSVYSTSSAMLSSLSVSRRSKVTPRTHRESLEPLVVKQPSTWDIACQNAIFKAIADENLTKLQKLLGIRSLKQATPSPHGATKPVSTHISPTAHQRREQNKQDRHHRQEAAFELIQKFFDTDTGALSVLISKSTAIYFSILLRACARHHRYQLANKKLLDPIFFHLPRRELEDMVTATCALEFYRDHLALLTIIEALERRAVHDGDSTMYYHLLQRLLTRAIDFHHEVENGNVFDTLYAKRLSLKVPADDTSEDRVVSVVSLPLPPNSAQPSNSMSSSGASRAQTFFSASISSSLSLKKRTVTEASLAHLDAARGSRKQQYRSSIFFPPLSSVVPIEQQSLMTHGKRPNMNVKYSTEDMEAILRARLTSSDKISVDALHLLGTIPLTSLNDGSMIQERLAQYIAHHDVQMEKNPNFILPFVLSDHWIGVRIQVYKESEFASVTYYDSSYQQERHDQVMALIIPIAEELFDCKVASRNAEHQLQQPDGVSCGVYFIENVYCDLIDKNGLYYQA
jgi:hypothetical protein